MAKVDAAIGRREIKSPADKAGQNPYGPVQGGETGGIKPVSNVAPKGCGNFKCVDNWRK